MYWTQHCCTVDYEPYSTDCENQQGVITLQDVDNLLCNGHTADNHYDETDSPTSDDDAGVADDNDVRSTSPTPLNIQHCSVDPVREVAPDLQVKIADLGNACWVVSLIKKVFSLKLCCQFFILVCQKLRRKASNSYNSYFELWPLWTQYLEDRKSNKPCTRQDSRSQLHYTEACVVLRLLTQL